jgi:hypothetical protein
VLQKPDILTCYRQLNPHAKRAPFDTCRKQAIPLIDHKWAKRFPTQSRVTIPRRYHVPMPASPAQSDLPKIKVSPRGVDRLSPAIYRSDIVDADGIPPGSLVTVTDQRGKFFGTALYSSSSQIAIRMLSPELVSDLSALLHRRIAGAIAYREKFVLATDAYRLIFSEADLIPRLIVDRYHDILSLQILTQAIDANPTRETVVSELVNQLRPPSVIERVDPRVRELETVPPRASDSSTETRPQPPSPIRVGSARSHTKGRGTDG